MLPQELYDMVTQDLTPVDLICLKLTCKKLYTPPRQLSDRIPLDEKNALGIPLQCLLGAWAGPSLVYFCWGSRYRFYANSRIEYSDKYQRFLGPEACINVLSGINETLTRKLDSLITIYWYRHQRLRRGTLPGAIPGELSRIPVVLWCELVPLLRLWESLESLSIKLHERWLAVPKFTLSTPIERLRKEADIIVAVSNAPSRNGERLISARFNFQFRGEACWTCHGFIRRSAIPRMLSSENNSDDSPMTNSRQFTDSVPISSIIPLVIEFKEATSRDGSVTSPLTLVELFKTRNEYNWQPVCRLLYEPAQRMALM